MQLDNSLFLDIATVIAAAAAGGLAARLARFPVLLGYIVVGMIMGPHGLEAVGDVESVRTLAEFGVVLLLFAVGVEVSFRDLRKMGKAVVLGGVLQVIAVVGLAYPLGFGLGWSPEQSVVFGMVVSLSSTMVVLKSLMDRGELDSVHGRLLTGILLIQDLAFIPMIAVLPAMGGAGSSLLSEVGLGLGKAVAVLAVMGVLGWKALPLLLRWVAHLGSREAFILTVVALTFAASAITEVAGLSAAVGAFVAGALLSESDFGHRALSEIIPLRDTFAALFFVSLGMLVDWTYLANNVGLVLATAAFVMVVKFILVSTLMRGFGYLPYTALLTGVGVVQIGEFSFLLAESATDRAIVDQNFLSLVVVSAVVTMALTPGVIAAGHKALSSVSQRFIMLRPYGAETARMRDSAAPLKDHVVICGLGRVGALVALTLEYHGIPYSGIDLDPHVVARHRGRGQYVINGSVSSDVVLEAAGVKNSRLMVISTGDLASAWVAAQHGLRMNPDLDIVARVRWRDEGERFMRLGVKEVVWPQMEAGLEILRHTLMRYQTDPEQVDNLLDSLRRDLQFGPNEDAEDGLPFEGVGERLDVDDSDPEEADKPESPG